MRKRIIRIAMCLTMCLAIGAIGGIAAAEQTIETVITEEEIVQAEFRVSSEEAEKQYLNGLFGLPVARVQDVALYNLRATVAGDLLNDGFEKDLYDALKAKVAQVAAGDETSTVFAFDEDDFDPVEFYAEDLGLESLFDNNDISANASQRINDIIYSMMDRAIRAVFYDCPYETYWRGLSYSRGFGQRHSLINASTGEKKEPVFVQDFIVIIYVSKDYQDSKAEKPDRTVSNRMDIVNAAVNNAHEIIGRYTNESDVNKLIAYKNEICGLVDYNTAAAGGSVSYGDPWQLVWVFDNDPETKVVCEGYSKAFMYLCDQTWKTPGTVDTICVSGTMYGSSSGPHMWNLVRMNGVNYLADITNSDNGSIGQFGGLFLDGYDRKEGDIYYYTTEGATIGGWIYSSGEVGYSYDEKMATTFAADLLDPAETAFKPSAPVPSITVTGNRAPTTNGQISFQVTSDSPEETGVSYQVALVSEDGGSTYVLGDFPCNGTEQTATLDGNNDRAGMIYRLQVTAYGTGFESQNGISEQKIYVTGIRDSGFTISAGASMTGDDTAQFATGVENGIQVTVPAGVSMIWLSKGEYNDWTSRSVSGNGPVWFTGYEQETMDAPLVARYSTNNGVNWYYSNVIFADYTDQGQGVPSGKLGDNLTWVLDQEGVLTISGNGDMQISNENTDGWRPYTEDIKEVIIEPGVTSIGLYAFKGCTGLTSVTIPASVNQIGYYTFLGCDNLTLTIYPSRFLVEYAKENNIPYQVYAEHTLTIPTETTHIETEAFKGDACEAVIIPDGIQSIGSEAFAECPNLIYVSLPSGFTDYDEFTFSGSGDVYIDYR